ncbi:hypothetical protein FPT12_25385 [Pseudomonas sp. H3(2019)]|nr:hypothetical protein FPT12_25385 [Pseudomonas sp. H3(2019)]
MVISFRLIFIVPMLCVGIHLWTLCVRSWDAERPRLHSHAEHGNDHPLPISRYRPQPCRCCASCTTRNTSARQGPSR